MLKLSPVQELDAAIRNAARDAERGVTNREIAEELCDSFPELMKPFIPVWITEKVASLVARDRAKVRYANAPQVVLFERSLGISRLPRTLLQNDGKPILREHATAKALQKLVTELRKQKSPVLQSAIDALNLMRKHTAENRRITYGEVLEIEAKAARK